MNDNRSPLQAARHFYSNQILFCADDMSKLLWLEMQWKDRIGRRLKLQDMHILLAAVESGSMAKAAEHLAISQPVVSRAIASLEHTLGVRLLDRSRSGIEPTLYGRALLTHGLAAFNELKRG